MPAIILLLILFAIYGYTGVKNKGDHPLWTQRQVNKSIGGSYVSSYKAGNQYVSSVNRQAAQQSMQNAYKAPAGQKVQNAYKAPAGQNLQNAYKAPAGQNVQGNFTAPATMQKKAAMAPEQRAVEDKESILGDVQDLMVKGYDGNLQFERDFLGEAMDTINSFSIIDGDGNGGL